MRLWPRQYYTLLSSFPALPRLQQAKVLPISRERLMGRLSMLKEEDAEVVNQLWNYFAYERQPLDRTDKEVVTFYNTIMREVSQPTLRAIIEFGMNQRTIVAGLRRRHRGLPAPRPGLIWGGGQWAGHIERHWSDADFNLATVFPWVPEIRRFLESNKTLSLERRLKDLSWSYLDFLAMGPHFSFDALLVYIAKWSLLNQWLLHDASKAAKRFETLTADLLVGHDQIFQTEVSV